MSLKRCFDIVLASFLMLVLSPLLGVLALAIFLSMGRPILFRQLRPGLHGVPFTLIKFRTMTDNVVERNNSLSDKQRLTVLGRLLRATSLDELPELWNVLKGEMSLVGPRPLLMDYLTLYSDEQARRHEVPPGMTGWAQVNGRNALSWPERFELDVWYVENQSLLLDLRILFMTIAKVLRREGISQNGHATMEPFRGNDA